jgi:hypothetical protein
LLFASGMIAQIGGHRYEVFDIGPVGRAVIYGSEFFDFDLIEIYYYLFQIRLAAAASEVRLRNLFSRGSARRATTV